MHQILALIIKEFRAIWKDKSARGILFAPPILQLFMFAFAVTLDVKNISLGIYNQDQGKESHELIQRFKGSPQFSDVFSIEKESDIKHVMDTRKAIVVLNFPADFSRKMRQGEPATMQAILDGRRSNSSLIVSGYVGEIADVFANEFNRQFNPRKAIPSISSIVVPRNWFNANLDYQWFTVTSLVAIIGMISALSLSSLTIAREREMGTFEQILVTPLTPTQILIGKLCPPVVVGLAQSVVMFAFAVTYFGIPFTGSILLLVAGMFVFLTSIIGVGLFISSLCTTQQQAVLGTFVFLTPTMTLSGFGAPVENIPMWLQYVSEISPLKHFLIVIKGIFLKDMPFAAVWANTWPNILIAVFTVSSSVWLFRRRIE